jgi:hypothetical protein
VNNQNTNGSQKEDPAEVQMEDALKVSEVSDVTVENMGRTALN